jgi:hypothetical protein
MEWGLAVVALALIAFGVVSRRLDGTPLTPAMIFVGVGLLVGAQALDFLDTSPTGTAVKILAEATLTVVLFADASRIDLRRLRQEYAVPARLLGIGLPLTIGFGALLAAALFGALSIPEALVLAVLLAPTDAALGQAVVTEPRLPSRIRQGLNVESGLNDGICVPLLFIVLADRVPVPAFPPLLSDWGRSGPRTRACSPTTPAGLALGQRADVRAFRRVGQDRNNTPLAAGPAACQGSPEFPGPAHGNSPTLGVLRAAESRAAVGRAAAARV